EQDLRARGERVVTYDSLMRPRGERIEWESEAERRLNNVPAPVRTMARIELERTAAERGIGRVTVALMEEVKAKYFGLGAKT
ncbi:MAG TPA: PCP reductase family protein, partial [Nitrospira sp.]|nr:PCP reductase family protein [Nitrospira sp.]